jgi:hypothetical protein
MRHLLTGSHSSSGRYLFVRVLGQISAHLRQVAFGSPGDMSMRPSFAHNASLHFVFDALEVQLLFAKGETVRP